MKAFQRAAALFWLLALLIASPAGAQTIKPLDVEQDPNGVDLLSGKVSTRLPVLSVPGASNLQLQKLQDLQPILTGQLIPNTNKSTYEINAGGVVSESFSCTDEICTSKKGNGSYLIADPYGKVFQYYEGGTGRLIYFDLQNYDQGPILPSPAPASFTFYPSFIQYPSGEYHSYNYTVHNNGGFLYRRVSSISSNIGYNLTFTYASNIWGQAGWSLLSQAGLYYGGNPSPVAQFTYSGNTITDLAGRQTTCVNCENGLVSVSSTTVTSLTLPGESAPAFSTEAQSRTYGSVTHSNWVTKVTADGVDWNYAFVPGYQPQTTISKVTITAPQGFSRQVNIFTAYQARPYITSIVDSFNRTTSYEYDNALRVNKITYPEGNYETVSYDLRGNITEHRMVAKPGSALADIVETAGYTAGGDCFSPDCFKPNWTRDAKGQQTDYTWSPVHGGLLTMLEPADANGQRRKTINEYSTTAPYRLIRERKCMTSSAGVSITCGTSAEIVREITYWNNTFLPASETLTNGTGSQSLTTSYTYDNAGRQLSIDGPMAGTGDTSYARYDVIGRKIWEIGKLGPNGLHLATRTEYRIADDKVVKVKTGTIPNPTSDVLTVFTTTDISYDSRRNPIRQKLSSGGTTTQVSDSSYTQRNQIECQTQRMNPAVFGSLPASACTLGTPGNEGKDRITKTVYDAEGRVLQVRKAVGTSLEQAYATYSYTNSDLQEYVIDANGNRAKLEYDGHNRQTKWIFPSTTAPTAYNPATQATALATAGAINTGDYEQYAYDANGNRISLRKRDGATITYAYDGLNRVRRKTIPSRAGLTAAQTRDVFYGYDIRNLELYARFDSTSGAGITTVYDIFGRISSSSINQDGTNRTLNYLYDNDGNRTRITHPDGVYFDMAYDNLDRLSNAWWTTPTGGITPFVGIAYDDRGRRATINRASSYTDYGYDSVNRLTTVAQRFAGGVQNVSDTFTYNPASQIRTTTRNNDAYAWTDQVEIDRGYAPNGLNQYVSTTTGAAYCYDANGNLTADGTTVYRYDVENRLVEARAQASAACPTASAGYTGAVKANLVYDPKGRLFELTGAGNTTRFLYDGDALVAEYNAGGAMLRRYMHGPGVDEPIMWDEGSAMNCSGSKFLHTNHQGSVIGVADCSGNLTAINAYDEWGIPAATNTGRFQYTGQAWLAELGLYYYKARIYSPTLGRFLQTDPIGYEDQVNLYAYVANDPINNLDPTGESCVSNEDQKGVTCQIDNPGELKGKDLDRANQVYTRAVNRLLVDPSREVKLQATDGDGNTVTETTTAGEIADGLINAEVTYSQSDGGRGWNASTDVDTGNITIYGNAAKQNDTGLARTIIHEGAHTTDANRALRSAYDGRGGILGRAGRAIGFSDDRHFNPAHQRSFKDAARILFGIKVP